MGKIQWKSNTEVDKETEKSERKQRFKGKEFDRLSRKEKDELLLILLEERGLI